MESGGQYVYYVTEKKYIYNVQINRCVDKQNTLYLYAGISFGN